MREQAALGIPYEAEPELVAMAMSSSYTDPVYVDDWELPAGAFGENAGPS